MQEFQHTVTAPDGVRLLVREYLPQTAAPRRNILLVHGACEHGGRYGDFARAATAEGWRVLIPDQRGHGLSTGTRVHLSDFQQYLDDLQLVMRQFTLAPRQTALVGHSMGGLVVARLLEGSGDVAAAACMLSPYLGLRVAVDRFTLLAGRILSVIWPTYRFQSRVRSVDLSQDEEYLARRRQDELISRSITAGWFFIVQRAVQQAHAEASRIHTPLLVLQGDQDHVVDPLATERWFHLLNQTDRELKILPGHLHELLQEPDRQQTVRTILDWLDTRVAK